MDEYSGSRMFGYGDETEQAENQPKPVPKQKPPPAQELLVWIQRGWAKPTISLRDIVIFAPRAFRDKATELKQVEILVQHGWLVEIKAHRYDRRLWRTPPIGATALPD
jgi:hypothetical protein